MIPVTKPFLPSKERYEHYLNAIWRRNWLTNNGPLVNELEIKLKDYLNVNSVHFVSNGTIALQIAIKALDIKGEVITTPFSYVATTSSLVWEGCAPVFVDINAQSFNIDASKIEEAITPHTTAILATHVYGNPCAIDAIDNIAKKHNLKVIYDAAHCFGTKYKGSSIFNYGDISTTSFHATKLFHTVEGGAVFSNDKYAAERIDFLRNFGHDGVDKFNGVGINGKNSEFHAAMGLANLPEVDAVLEKRLKDHQLYDNRLASLDLQKPLVNKHATYNYSYYPVVFNSEESCLAVFNNLARKRIGARRYFYPTLSSLDYVEKQNTPIADDIAKRILCLPLYEQLTEAEVDMIARAIIEVFDK